MTLRALTAGEWPTGIHWTPGEVRRLPDGYPVPGDPPAWLEHVEESDPPTKRRRRTPPEGSL